MVPVVVMQPGAEASGCAVLSSELYTAIGFRCLADLLHAAMRPVPAAIKAWATIVGRAHFSLSEGLQLDAIPSSKWFPVAAG
jgi:hypothetical protein